MDDDFFTLDGKSGRWICAVQISSLPSSDTFSASADIALRGQSRCKRVLSLPGTSRDEGLKALKKKCLDWIERAEAEASPIHAQPRAQEARSQAS